MRTVTGEIRRAWQGLWRSPGYAITAIGMLAAGLGLSMYMFGAVNAFLLRPLPFPEAERIAHVELADPATGRDSVEMPVHEYLDLRTVQSVFDTFAIYGIGTVNLSGDARPERYEGGFMGPQAFETLGVTPLIGRAFVEADYAEGAPPVVVLGHGLWMQRFGADPDVVGRTVRVNGKPGTVVGVMPPGFRFPLRQDLWAPFDLDVSDVPRGRGRSGEVIGRLKPGTTFATAAAMLDPQLAAIAERHPDTVSRGMNAVVKPLGDEYVGRNTRAVLLAMMLAVLFVLVIACANVAQLMAARSAERAREFAIHAALGAGRHRLLARMVLEGLMVAGLAGIIGLALAQWGGALTMRVLSEQEDGIPYWMHYVLDARSIAFALGVAVFAALVATLGPAWRASRAALAGTLREGGAGSIGRLGRAGRVMVAAEIALCAVLLVAAGLTVRSIHAMQTFDIGAEVEGVMSGRVVLFEDAYADDAAVLRFFEELERRLAALPGVEAAALTTSVPVSFAAGVQYLKPGDPRPENGRLPFTYLVTATPGYFETFRIPVLRGRGLAAHDRADAPPVALVNTDLAERLWPGQDPLGQRLDLDPSRDDDVPVEIVGVVPRVVQSEPEDGFFDTLYVPMAQRPARFVSLAVRGGGDPRALAAPMREAVQSLDPDLPVYFVRTVGDWIASHTVADRLLADLFSLFAFFGLLLAGAGIYALLSRGVTARTREIGVRRALGAEDRGILRLVLREGMVQLALGLGLGLVAALAFAQILANVLFGVGTFDPLTLTGVVLTLSIVVLAASFVPTRRALAVQPMQALRYE